MRFTSKKDWWMGLIIWATILFSGCVIYEIILTDFSFITFLLLLFTMIFCLFVWFHTTYTITEDTLLISYGPIKQKIPLHSMTSIRQTTAIFTAPALSRHRVEINYGFYESVQVSPKDMERFIAELEKRVDGIRTINL
ncbi:PH domain-containing protein [Kurthia huakuii]|uniref:PH domain-containing protein n=1 Tax=Kurthia huakuii TaxID=1421019 RepID=UPI000496999D|nr:PH domain-containing protein [Kurthia huakuii]MBM7700618.1 energy-coupling factor transporter transmembrane protein EcfT [Kurthia huakuii]